MKASPMIFNADMVRALLDGSKTQTRRPIKYPAQLGKHGWHPTNSGFEFKEGGSARPVSPFGMIGDLIYVRETCRAEELRTFGVDGVRYMADEAWIGIENTPESADKWVDLNHYRHGKGLTVPSIHQPRWASRLTLRITDVRVERVQDISLQDVRKEGVGVREFNLFGSDKEGRQKIAAITYSLLWKTLYNNWDDNPWVWVYEFEVIHQNVDAVIEQEAE